ncbi:helix-turn-helix domain-containing protein, partial [Rhodothalassium salexigens]|uniref:helix-turn-helix domain-containing protein n=1 Tax=Rhodothalassium salexigens TaxID=1086 RepID=UPI001904DEE0
MIDRSPPDEDDNPEWDETNCRSLTDGEKLVVARVKLGLTQQSMADLLSVSVATLRDWERQRTKPRGPSRALIQLVFSHPETIR